MLFHGRIIEILDLRGGTSARTGEKWCEQSFVVESDGRYPVRICFSIFGENKIKEANLKVNAYVDVHFDIAAKKNNGRWFNDIQAYKVEYTPKQPLLHQEALNFAKNETADNPEAAVKDALESDNTDFPW